MLCGMHPLLVAGILLARADCAAAEPTGPTLPLSLNLPNSQGQVYVAIPAWLAKRRRGHPQTCCGANPATCCMDLAGQPYG